MDRTVLHIIQIIVILSICLRSSMVEKPAKAKKLIS
jgi:hypothetical protein